MAKSARFARNDNTGVMQRSHHVCEPRLKLVAPEAHSLTLGTLIYFRHFSSL